MAVPEATSADRRFLAGAAMATLAPLALTPAVAHGATSRTPEILGVLVVVAYTGHVAATGHLWRAPEVRALVRARPARLVVLPVAIVFASSAGALVLPSPLEPALLLGFFAWQFTHFQRQNLGLVALVGTRWGAAPMTVGERRLVAVAGAAGTAALVARPALLGLPHQLLPMQLATDISAVSRVGYCACLVVAALAAWRAAVPTAVAVARLTAVLFVAPLFVFGTPGAAVTGMVIAHGLQYHWAVGWRTGSSRAGGSRWHGWARLGALAVIGGTALQAMSEQRGTAAPAGRLLYGAYLGVVMAHFALDAALWRRPARPYVPPAPPGALLPSAPIPTH